MEIDISSLRTKKNNQKKPIFDVSNLEAFFKKDIQFTSSNLNDKKKEAFYLELGILVSAGVDIKTTLEIIVKEQENKKDKELYAGILSKIIEGSSLSEALKSSGKFSNYEYFSMQIGEESGKLPFVLSDLATFFLSKIKQRRQFISALSYPFIILMTSFGAIFFMMQFIVPMFADIFKKFGGDLPFITKVIVTISDGVRNNFYLIILSLLALFIFIYTSKEKFWFRKYLSLGLLKLPIMGELFRKIYLARFCYSLHLLISSKIPLLRAIGLVKQMIEFYPIENALNTVEKDILNGTPLYVSLQKYSIFPHRMISLIKIGEEVNKMDVFFEKIGKQYTDEIEHQSAILSSLIEPFMIIFLGIIVGIILIAMYLPLFQLSNQF